jgi:hypothetical protein
MVTDSGHLPVEHRGDHRRVAHAYHAAVQPMVAVNDRGRPKSDRPTAAGSMARAGQAVDQGFSSDGPPDRESNAPGQSKRTISGSIELTRPDGKTRGSSDTGKAPRRSR